MDTWDSRERYSFVVWTPEKFNRLVLVVEGRQVVARRLVLARRWQRGSWWPGTLSWPDSRSWPCGSSRRMLWPDETLFTGGMSQLVVDGRVVVSGQNLVGAAARRSSEIATAVTAATG